MSHGTWVWLPTSYHWRGGQECYAPYPTAWLKVNQAVWNFHCKHATAPSQNILYGLDEALGVDV